MFLRKSIVTKTVFGYKMKQTLVILDKKLLLNIEFVALNQHFSVFIEFQRQKNSVWVQNETDFSHFGTKFAIKL